MIITGLLLTVLSCIPREEPPEKSLSLVSENSLPDVLRENSGMTMHDGLIWFINDSGNDSALYGYSRQQNDIIRTVRVKNSVNTDWEDITQNEQHIFIGDFGNNASGNRTDLRIYMIDKADLETSDTVIPSGVIRFSYEDQSDFTPQDPNATPFDCEAFIATENKIILFTKDWETYQTRVYQLTTTPGTQVAEFHHEWKVDGLITGAATYSDKLYLIGYGFSAMPFLWEFTGFEASTLHYDDRMRTDFEMNGITQTEGITVLQDGTVLVSSEEFNLIPPGSPATLFVLTGE